MNINSNDTQEKSNPNMPQSLLYQGMKKIYFFISAAIYAEKMR
jgi:hypothetical protein